MIKRTGAFCLQRPLIRRGNIAVEVLLMTPIVVGLILAVVELSLMTATSEQLAAASREGCRVAALGGDLQEVERAVYNHLGNGNLRNAVITVVFLEDEQRNPVPVLVTLDKDGNPTSSVIGDGEKHPTPPGDPVLVRVEIPANVAVPDLLTFIGFSIKSKTLSGQTIMRKEGIQPTVYLLWQSSQEPSEMKASTLFAITIAVFLGLSVVAAAKYAGIFNNKPPAPQAAKERPKVLVAAKNLFESMVISPADVAVREMTDEEIAHYRDHKDKYLAPKVEAGAMRVLTRSVEADQPLLREYLDDINLPQAINRRLSSPQMRAVNVTLLPERATGGMIQRGEHVDVFLTTRVSVAGKSESAINQTAPIARSLKVIVKRNMLWNALAPVDPKKPIAFTLEANLYRAALIEFARTKGELSLVPTAAPQESLNAASRSSVSASFSDPASKEYQNEDERVAEVMRGERAVGDSDLERIFNLKPIVVAKPIQIQEYTGIHYKGTRSFGPNGNGLMRPNTAEPSYYQFSPVSNAKDSNGNNDNKG